MMIIGKATRAAAIGAGLLLGLLTAAPAEAGSGRQHWCANTVADGMRDCSYFTLQQCLTTLSGQPGYCSVNLRQWFEPEEPSRRRRHRHRR